MPEMTPADALKILTDVTAEVPMKRREQQVVLTAIETLRVAITPKPTPEEKRLDAMDQIAKAAIASQPEVVKGVTPE